MTSQLENKLLLILLKEFNLDYNPSSISKKIGCTRVGAFKALKRLEKKEFVISRVLGKASFYRLNFNNPLCKKYLETLLIEEAQSKKRWMEELRVIYKMSDIIVLFGSMIRSEKNAKDVDILAVFDETNNEKIEKAIYEKNKILIKPIHLIKQTREEMKSNLSKKDRVLLSAVKEGIVMHGHEKFVEMIETVQN